MYFYLRNLLKPQIKWDTHKNKIKICFMLMRASCLNNNSYSQIIIMKVLLPYNIKWLNLNLLTKKEMILLQVSFLKYIYIFKVRICILAKSNKKQAFSAHNKKVPRTWKNRYKLWWKTTLMIHLGISKLMKICLKFEMIYTINRKLNNHSNRKYIQIVDNLKFKFQINSTAVH